MKCPVSRLATLLLPILLGSGWTSAPGQEPTPAPEAAGSILESYPSEFQARLDQRLQLLNKTAGPALGQPSHHFISLTRRWQPGQTITIAFRGGDKTLHKQIADAVTEWTNYANLKFDFGRNPTTGEYRHWQPSDTSFAADIRVSFDQEGYYSLVGTDSSDPQIISPAQESLNLSRFDFRLPFDWKTTALHEFGHAIGFEHEHQNPNETCDFRFDDDPGYVSTRNGLGQFTNDPTGKRPGLYTFLGGPPNNWHPAQVDFNLKPLQATSAFEFLAGPFDKLSIMRYHFDKTMYVDSASSDCSAGGPNLVISAQDKVGAAKVYPRGVAEIATARNRRVELLEKLSKVEALPATIKSHYSNMLNKLRD